MTLEVGTTHQHILRLQDYNSSSKKQEIINLGKDTEKREPLRIVGKMQTVKATMEYNRKVS